MNNFKPMNEKPTRREDLTFGDLPPGAANVLLTDDNGNFWLGEAAKPDEAKPVSLSESMDWAMEAYSLSNESPAWPPAMMGRAARALAD
jgi:hypothetical protein